MSNVLISAVPNGQGVIRVALAIKETFRRFTDGQTMAVVDLDDDDLTCLHDAFAPDPEAETGVRRRIAGMLWSLAREDEDRCDIDLDDLPANHLVHRQAAALMSLLKRYK